MLLLSSGKYIKKGNFKFHKRKNLIKMHPELKNIKFANKDFIELDVSKLNTNDFVYIDPPYLISIGLYNDGKRGVGIWTKDDELDLYKFLDNFNDNNISFALSNVIIHNGKINNTLKDWIAKYKIIELEKNYKNSNYQKQDKTIKSKEILILNY